MLKECFNKAWTPVYANDLDAWVPEVWAQESLMVLEANMVAAQLVHRDFSDEIAQQGDVVNTRRPNRFVAKKKVDTDDVTVQDATATNVPVVLDQHIHTSFLIRDGEESKGFAKLRDEYLVPAMWSIAQAIDEVVLLQLYEFIDNNVGQLGVTPTKTTVINAREQLNIQKAPIDGRSMIITPSTEGALLDIPGFVEADKVGDEGTALREGSLGRKFGINFFMSQNAPSIAAGNTVVLGDVNEAAGYVAGTTSIDVTVFAGEVVVGTWLVIAGDNTPQLVTARTGTAPTTNVVITPGLKRAVVDAAIITTYVPGAVDGALAAGFPKPVTIDGFTVAPKTGQMVSFGADGIKYGAQSDPTTTEVQLNRALDAALANDDVMGIGPAGDYNFAFHRNAIALVTRPLAQPAAGTGALSSVANFNDLSIRVVITYDGDKQGHLVTVDLLAGVKTLDLNLGVVMLG